LAKKGSRISKAERASSQDTPATANLEGEIYKFASKLTWLGIIEAKTEGEAIEIASKEFTRSPSAGNAHRAYRQSHRQHRAAESDR
jgi:hypothetical protein